MKFNIMLTCILVVLLCAFFIGCMDNQSTSPVQQGVSLTKAATVSLNSWQCNNHSSGLNIWTGGVGSWTVGAWIEFNSVNISGATNMNFNLASTQSGSYKIVLDNTSGTQIGTLNFNSTGSWSTYNNQSCSLNLNGNSGNHNIYIIDASGAANLGTLTLNTSGGGSSSSSSSSSSSGGGTSGNVYLCFDDGPSNSNSGNLVNALKNAGCNQATLFIIGQNIASNSSGWNVYKNSGFSCQNHSQTHQHMTSWSYQQVYNDLSACNTAIQNGGKPKPTKIRLPYLENNSTISSACSALGLSIVSPNIDSQDWNGASTSAIISAVSNLQAGQNALQHDWPANTVAAIPTIVQNLKNKGHGFAQY
jgi:peptidoglycan/xylan/chitin deacetylase (PgdA/CDA1 family)